jgi:hypothetical protein
MLPEDISPIHVYLLNPKPAVSYYDVTSHNILHTWFAMRSCQFLSKVLSRKKFILLRSNISKITRKIKEPILDSRIIAVVSYLERTS